MPAMVAPDHLCYYIFTYVNHHSSWSRSSYIASLPQAERHKADHYQELGQEERSNYAPMVARYTQGVGIKRQFGMTVMSRKGEEKYQEIMTNWVRALSDPVTREAVEEGWREWTITHKAYQALEMRERQGEVEEVVAEVERGEAAPEILMPGDEGYGGGWGNGSAR